MTNARAVNTDAKAEVGLAASLMLTGLHVYACIRARLQLVARACGAAICVQGTLRRSFVWCGRPRPPTLS